LDYGEEGDQEQKADGDFSTKNTVEEESKSEE